MEHMAGGWYQKIILFGHTHVLSDTEHVWIGRFINVVDLLIKSAKQCELIEILQIRCGKGREEGQT